MLSLPTDRPRPTKLNFQGSALLTEIPSSLHAQLQALAKAEGCTLYTMLLSAWFVLLHRYSFQDDIIVGSPMACRAEPERQGCVGYYVRQIRALFAHSLLSPSLCLSVIYR